MGIQEPIWHLKTCGNSPKFYTSIESHYKDSNRNVEPAVMHVMGFSSDTFDIVKLNNLGEVIIMGRKIDLSEEQTAEVKKFVEAWFKQS